MSIKWVMGAHRARKTWNSEWIYFYVRFYLISCVYIGAVLFLFIFEVRKNEQNIIVFILINASFNKIQYLDYVYGVFLKYSITTTKYIDISLLQQDTQKHNATIFF